MRFKVLLLLEQFGEEEEGSICFSLSSENTFKPVLSFDMSQVL